MNIRRFFAPDMRRAIRLVRDEHGADAVILSSRAVDGGMEIVSAVDYDHDLLAQMVQSNRPSAADGEGRETAAAGDRASPDPLTEGDTEADADADADAEVDAKLAAGSAVAPGYGHLPRSVGANEPPRVAVHGGPRPAEASAELASTEPASVRAASAEPGLAESAAGAARGWNEAPPAGSDGRTLKAIGRELRAVKGMLREQLAQLAWADLMHFEPERAWLVRRVCALGLEPELAETLVAEIEQPESARAWREVLFGIARRLTVPQRDPLDEGGIFALIGPTGAGKTTTIAKLAARHCLRHDRDSLALISTDTVRVGAQRQLDAYGAILGVPVRRAAGGEELARMLRDLGQRRLVLIDTAGMAPRDQALAAALDQLDTGMPINKYLVLSASTQAEAMREAIRHFGGAGLAGAVITKLDEAVGLGAVISMLVSHELPAVWLCDGQRVPEDLRLAQVTHLLGWTLEQARVEQTAGVLPVEASAAGRMPGGVVAAGLRRRAARQAQREVSRAGA